jgi:hypothetical protein
MVLNTPSLKSSSSCYWLGDADCTQVHYLEFHLRLPLALVRLYPIFTAPTSSASLRDYLCDSEVTALIPM